MTIQQGIIRLLIVSAVGGGIILWTQRDKSVTVPPPAAVNAPANSTDGNESQPSAPTAPEIVAQDLRIPWEVAFLPDGSMLVTERPGTLRRITPDKASIPVAGVAHVGEGGLLGLAIHPNFKDNHFIYLYSTSNVSGRLTNRVERYRLAGNALSDRKIIIEGMNGSSNHDGGRMAFGPDGDLYITVGDAEQSNSAQDTNSLNGKILRLKDDGAVPGDNPFGNAVYSYGHRNPQGLAWDDKGRLWATEHGPSASSDSGKDELNVIEKGKNYGWPIIKGDQKREGMVTPVVNSGSGETWAPSGLAYLDGNLYFSGLRGATLYQAKINTDGSVVLSKHLQNQYGRLRAVTVGSDGLLYISTSNTDGRGTVKPGDDKVIRLPKIL